ATELLEVPLEDATRGGIPGSGTRGDLRRRGGLTAGGAVRRLEGGAGEEGFHAATPSAVAGRALRIHGVVAPFAGDVLGTRPHPPVVDDAASDAGPEDDPEDEALPAPAARARLGERKAVGIVLETHGEVEAALEVVPQGTPVETGGVRVLHPAVACRERAR